MHGLATDIVKELLFRRATPYTAVTAGGAGDAAAIKGNAQIDHSGDDSLVLDPAGDNGIIPTAVETIERMGNVALITQTRRQTFDKGFSALVIPIGFPPLQSVESIKYLDARYVEQTVAPELYRLDVNSTPGRVSVKSSYSWPTLVISSGSVGRRARSTSRPCRCL